MSQRHPRLQLPDPEQLEKLRLDEEIPPDVLEQLRSHPGSHLLPSLHHATDTERSARERDDH